QSTGQCQERSKMSHRCAFSRHLTILCVAKHKCSRARNFSECTCAQQSVTLPVGGKNCSLTWLPPLIRKTQPVVQCPTRATACSEYTTSVDSCEAGESVAQWYNSVAHSYSFPRQKGQP